MRIKIILISLILLSLLTRFIPLDFPIFTTDEARIAFRGYALSKYGSDELARIHPFIFNSLSDYQLPVTSYLTAFGTLLFGKTDFAVRLPFMIIGVLIVLLSFKIAQRFKKEKIYAWYVFCVVAFSPVLIFFSKIPNEFIVLTLLNLILFYLLIQEKIETPAVLIIVTLQLLTSKSAAFTILPFVIFTLFIFRKKEIYKKKIIISLSTAILTFSIVILFLQIPQSGRSILENNFSILQDVTLKNGIDKLRGQGVESGWPNILEKFLFNKSYSFVVGVSHWLSHLQLRILFAQFDKGGEFGFMNMGMFSKLLITPFIIGIWFLIKTTDFRKKTLLIYPLIQSFPLLFLYPNNDLGILLPILPYLAFIIAFGLINLKFKFSAILIIFMVGEIILNLFYFKADEKNAAGMRPLWIKEVVNQAYLISLTTDIAISDDLTRDLAPFMQWYTPINFDKTFANIDFPYKFTQTKLTNIKIIGESNNFYNCGQDKPTQVIASKRDFKKIKRWLNRVALEKEVQKVYLNDYGEESAFILPPNICIN